MSFTRASFHFLAADGQPVATFYRHTDGYPSGAATYLRSLLLDWGAFSVEAFALGVKGDRYGSSQAKDLAGDSDTRFRYTFEGENVRGEERLVKGQEQWKEVYNGPVLALVNAHGPMLHRLGPDALRLGGAEYATLETLETRYAQAESRRLRHEAGVVALGGRLAAGQAEELRQQVLSAMRAEVAAGHVAPAIA